MRGGHLVAVHIGRLHVLGILRVGKGLLRGGAVEWGIERGVVDGHVVWYVGRGGEGGGGVFFFFAHAVDFGPEALFEPADLLEDFFAAGHFFFAVAGGGYVGEFVDEGAGGVDEFAEGGGGPVGDEGLVEGDDVGVGRGCGERGAEG